MNYNKTSNLKMKTIIIASTLIAYNRAAMDLLPPSTPTRLALQKLTLFGRTLLIYYNHWCLAWVWMSSDSDAGSRLIYTDMLINNALFDRYKIFLQRSVNTNNTNLNNFPFTFSEPFDIYHVILVIIKKQ